MAHHTHTHEDHLDPTHEITLDVVKDRAKKGIIILTGRTFILQAISFAAWFFLTIFLDASEIGVFFVVTAVVSFFRYFSDVGLAAALIQKKESVSRSDLYTTFTIQQILVLTVLVVLMFFSPFIRSYYGLSFEGMFLLYSLGVGFLLSSLKTIPSVLLERKLDFQKLVIPDMIENLVYNISAVIFAWQGLGIMSFSYAVLIRGVVGVVSIYVIHPWKPGFALSMHSLKQLLNFGVPYQINTFLATIKDDGMTAFLGGILGTSGLGYLGWAQKWAQTPLRLFMDNITRVTFPAFSRMQESKIELAKSVTRSIFFICFLVFPSVTGIVLLAPILIDIIPKYEKWEPALIPLGLVSINVLFAAATTQLTNLLNAIGKIRITFKLMVMWTILTWVCIPYLAFTYGVNGAAAGYALVGSSSIIAVLLVRKYVNFSLIESVGLPLLATFSMAFVMRLLYGFIPSSIIGIILYAAVGGMVYLLVIYLLLGKVLFLELKNSVETLINKK